MTNKTSTGLLKTILILNIIQYFDRCNIQPCSGAFSQIQEFVRNFALNLLFNPHLKKVEGCINHNVVRITSKMKTVVRLIQAIQIINPDLKNSETQVSLILFYVISETLLKFVIFI